MDKNQPCALRLYYPLVLSSMCDFHFNHLIGQEPLGKANQGQQSSKLSILFLQKRCLFLFSLAKDLLYFICFERFWFLTQIAAIENVYATQ